MPVRGDTLPGPDAATQSLVGGYRPLAGVPDEMMDASGRIRPHWLPLLRRLGMAPEQLAAIRFDVSVPKQ